MPSESGKALKRALDRCRRRHPRYRADFPVSVTLFAASDRQLFQAHCRDLSQAGMGVIVAAELPLGEVASLSFALPESKLSWEIRAVLRHRRGYHYGFEFLSFSDQQRQMLESYLRGHAPADGDAGTGSEPAASQ